MAGNDHRQVRRLAGQLRLCRRALGLWHAPVDEVHRPWMSIAPPSATRALGGATARLIFVASLVDDGEQPIEHHVVEVGVSGWHLRDLAACTRVASAALSAWLAPRARRLEARAARRGARDRHARNAVERHIRLTSQARPNQPDLFTGRLAIEFERVASERGLITQAVTDVPPARPGPIAGHTETRVTLAPPRLVALFVGSRRERR